MVWTAGPPPCVVRCLPFRGFPHTTTCASVCLKSDQLLLAPLYTHTHTRLLLAWAAWLAVYMGKQIPVGLYQMKERRQRPLMALATHCTEQMTQSSPLPPNVVVVVRGYPCLCYTKLHIARQLA